MGWVDFDCILHAKSNIGCLRISMATPKLMVLDCLGNQGWYQIAHVDVVKDKMSYDKSIEYLKNYAKFIHDLS